MLPKIKRLIASTCAVALVMLVAMACFMPPTHAASLTISSPANGQTFTGNDFTVSGVADADATIILIRNGLTIAQTRSDGSGNWSYRLTDLPDGDNSITVRSIKNTGYGYFIAGEQSNQAIHQLRFSDNVIDPVSPFPITDSGNHVIMMPSPTDNIFYVGGNFSNQDNKPAKFDNSNPGDPVEVTGDYPADASINKGDFSADGTKYFSPNNALTTISVVDTASNAWSKDIELGESPVTAVRGPGNKIYVLTHDNTSTHMVLIDATSDTIVKTVSLECSAGLVAPTVTFSQDSAYPYYFVPCLDSNNLSGNKILKYNLATDELVAQFPVQASLTSAVLNADNTRLYLSSTTLLGNNANADKTFVIDTSSGTLLKTITMHAGIIGAFPSPDLQHIYIATPGDLFNNNPSNGIDILDMLTDQVSHVATDGTALAITAPFSAATLSNVNVAVVLGVKTTSSQLAKTGMFVALASPIGLFLVGAALYTFTDYKRHKQPLLAVDPNVNYSYFHHLKVVSIPLVKYRFSISVDRRIDDHSDDVRRF